MLNVNELKRNAKNIVKKYSDAQVKVREATSNDPWGPSSTIMAEIADMTYNVVAFSEIMQMIWRRLNDHGKNWRHVFKSLVLLEYLIKTGNEKVAQQCIENIFAIQTLKDFQYIEENKDHGSSVREKSKRLVALLKDPERLKAERSRALKAKSRLVEAVSSSGQSGSFGSPHSRGSNFSGDMSNHGSSSGGGGGGGSSSSGMLSNNSNYQFAEADSSSNSNSAGLRSDIDSARPHSLTEEETQLQIALALSKEEAERQEKTRKNDELRLKLALDVSKAAAGTANSESNHFMDDFSEPAKQPKTSGPAETRGQQASNKSSKQSNIDDLLGLSFTPAEEAANAAAAAATTSSQAKITSTVQNALFSSNVATSSSIGSPLEAQNDPWSVDPWQSNQQLQPTMNSNVISAQPAPIHQLAAGFSTPLATTLPSTQPTNTATAAATTIVPNHQFSISNMESIFPTNQAKKTLSRNPFED